MAFCFFAVVTATLSAQTISEKKASLTQGNSELDKETQVLLSQMNDELQEKQDRLYALYDEVKALKESQAKPEEFRSLLQEINQVRNSLRATEGEWRQRMSSSNREEPYALWHQPETTLEQLIIEYGSQDYAYLIPAELASVRFSVTSNLPIPRSSWGEMLEVILVENGIGIKQINPYLRELFPLKSNLSGLQLLTAKREELDLYPKEARVAFLLSPQETDARRVFHFLEKFANANSTTIHLLGRDILLAGQVSTVQEMLKVYDFIASTRGGKDYRFVALTKINAEEMAKILTSIFGDNGTKRPSRLPVPGEAARPTSESEEPGLKVITLAQSTRALFLLGTPEELRKAEEIIHEVENQLSETKDRTVYWYTVKHSDAKELAEMLEKVYSLMTNAKLTEMPQMPPGMGPGYSAEQATSPFYADTNVVIRPTGVTPGVTEPRPPEGERHNFIVDSKTGSIVMVVETDLLPRIKDLLRRLDVPKKMVQIDVLLFEKRMSDRSRYGLNLLRIGSAATNTHSTSLTYNDDHRDHDDFLSNGILSFMLSRMSGHGWPAIDLAYNFLLTQDDVQINASPSVTTINQTPATIAIVEEISVNTGVVELDTTQATRLKDAYARAQYGIIIKITPTIHAFDETLLDPNSPNYITLDTDIVFDTVQPSVNNRPDVTRRNIKNQVRVADGETVILGGLRRLNINDGKEAIPFLGEIPGLGKLFSTTSQLDNSTEMFMFITPRIIQDDKEAYENLRCEELCRRPGDVPEFLECVAEGKDCARRRLFEGGLKMLLGR